MPQVRMCLYHVLAVAAVVTLTAVNSVNAAPLTYTWDANASVAFSDGATGNLAGTFTIDPPGNTLSSSSSIVLTGGQEAGTYQPILAFGDTVNYGFGAGPSRAHVNLIFLEDLTAAPQHPLLLSATWAQGGGSSDGTTTGGAHLAVPEPSSLALLGGALLLTGLRRWRRSGPAV